MFEMFGISPEEYQARMEEQRLHHESYHHDFHEWLDTLDEKGLKLIRTLLLQYSEQPSAAYVVGFVSFLLEKKFNICAACGKDHSAPLTTSDILGDLEPKPNGDESNSFAMMSGPELLSSVSKDEQSDMDKYRVDFIEYQYPKVVCRDCGTEYVSLDDRMLRDPGVKGCEGCVNKAKWG